MTHPRRVRSTSIVQAGAHGSDLGVMELIFDGVQLIASNSRLIPIDHGAIKADPAMAAKVDQVGDVARPKEGKPRGEARDWLIRAQTLAGAEPRKRDQESPVDSLFADIVREVTHADVVFLPGVGYGVAIPPGPITAEALKNLMPHESRIVAIEMSGAQLLGILEQSIENTYTNNQAKKVGGIIQVSGLAFTYDEHRPFGERVIHASISGKALNAPARYRVATNSLLAQGGYAYQAFPAMPRHSDLCSEFEIIATWLRDHPGIITPRQGRIQRRTDGKQPGS